MTNMIKIGFVALALVVAGDSERAGAQNRGENQPAHPAQGTAKDHATGVQQGSTNVSLPATTPDQVRREAQQMFGFVPQLVQIVPDALIVGFWASLKGLQLSPDTALDGKTKELIGLAVAAQIPCEFCVYFHTSAARKHGATDAEIKEAIGMAALTRMASTMLNGSQLDSTAFRKESDRIIKREKKSPAQARTSGARPR
jgi:AhpD family alkylhydroperoxidase